jgi:hypothetical protein
MLKNIREYIHIMSEHDSMMIARDLFLARENIAGLSGRLKLKGDERLTKQQLANWYDAFMTKHRVEASKIDNVITWMHYMTEEYIRGYMGHHCIESEDVPYLPYQGDVRGAMNNKLIEQTRSDGKFPKFKLESAIEDRRDENGNIVIRNLWRPERMFQPVNSWRHPGSKGKSRGPVSKLLQRQQQNAGSRLYDKEYAGETLNNWEPLHRKHTKRDMSIFLINEDRRTKIAARGPSSPEFLW